MLAGGQGEMTITILKAIGSGRFLASDGKSVFAAESALAQPPVPGDEAEAEQTAGALKIVSSHAPSFFSEGPVATSRSDEVNGARLLESASSIKAGGEGASHAEAFAAMCEAARSVNANAVIDMRLECAVRRFPAANVLYRCVGRPAIVDGGKFRARPGIHINTRAPARTNSPNRAMARYIRVLLASGLFIALPIASRLCALHGLAGASQWICLAIVLAALACGIAVFPKSRRSFILR
jgi:hypothetical protein